MLFQIADFCLPAFGQIAAVVFQLSRDDFEQGGFAGTVDTDKTDLSLSYTLKDTFSNRVSPENDLLISDPFSSIFEFTPCMWIRFDLYWYKYITSDAASQSRIPDDIP